MHLNRLVNHGHSFEGADELYELLAMFPLQHSFFHLFKPTRSVQFPQPSDRDAGLSNYHFILYDKDEGKAIGRYHSDIGTDVHLYSHSTEGLCKVHLEENGK